MSRLRQALRTVVRRTVLPHNVLLPITGGRRYVFTYHDISQPDRAHYHPVYSTSPADFHRQVDQLSSLFTLVSLSDIVAAPPEDRRHLAAIVFDDGFASVLEHAHPFLSARGIPFAIFVNRQAIEEDRLWCTDVVLGNRDRPYLTRLYERYVQPSVGFDAFVRNPLDYLVVSDRLGDDYAEFYARSRPASRIYLNRTEVQGLAKAGVTVGSHTSNHKVLSRCGNEALTEEIVGNRDYLGGLLGVSIDHFAFPFGFEGMLDQRSASLARSLHPCLYSTQRLSFRGAHGAPPFPIPRIGLQSDSAGELMTSINLPFFSRQSPGFPGVCEEAPLPRQEANH